MPPRWHAEIDTIASLQVRVQRRDQCVIQASQVRDLQPAIADMFDMKSPGLEQLQHRRNGGDIGHEAQAVGSHQCSLELSINLVEL